MADSALASRPRRSAVSRGVGGRGPRNPHLQGGPADPAAAVRRNAGSSGRAPQGRTATRSPTRTAYPAGFTPGAPDILGPAVNWRDFHGLYPATVSYLVAVAVLIALVQLLEFFGLVG